MFQMAIGSSQWNRIFGEGWQALTEINPDMGLFLIDHDSRTADIDDNAVKILNMQRRPGYEELVLVISQLTEFRSEGSRVTIKPIIDTDTLYAGFVRIHHLDNQGDEEFILPVYSQSRLVASMIENAKRPSLFALIQLEERDRMTLTGAQVYAALSALVANTPTDTIISSHARTRFWLYIPGFEGDEEEYLGQLQDIVKACSNERDPEKDPANRYSLTFSAGCGAVTENPSQRMHTAEYTLYQATSMGTGSICRYSMEKYEAQKNEYANIRKFLHLVDNNLISYHFQPIVEVRSGDVVAYEALMRTDSSISMKPLEIISYARQLKRLYDIEKLTMRNTLEAVSRHQEALHKRKLFVNSIPAFMLSDNDWRELELQFGELLEKVVIELTEQSEPSPEMLEVVHERLGRNHMQLAIDDYGTGYSNTSNLVKYKPDVVKIDRSLIEDINLNPKMQRLVQGLIEFMHENGYLALAEGVETYEEMKTMIQLGSDLLQGYYVSKPKPVMIYDISSNIKNEITKINLEFSSEITRSYHPKENEVVDLCELIRNRYNAVFIEVPNVTLIGERDKMLNLTINIKDGVSTRITLRNVYLSSEHFSSIIALGENCFAEINIEASNELMCRGILVPMSSTLKLVGNGALSIRAEMTNSFAIGTDVDNSPGNIITDMDGMLTIETSGEYAVGIGGGKNDGNTKIELHGGKYIINGSGTTCIAIGSINGQSNIKMTECECRWEVSSTNGTGIGSVKGETDIFVKDYNFSANMRGTSLCAIGVGTNGRGKVSMTSGRYSAVMRGSNLKCIGTYDGQLDCDLHLSQITLECEGRTAAGIGDLEGSGIIIIDHCGVKCHMLSSNYIDLGTRTGTLTVDGTQRDIVIND